MINSILRYGFLLMVLILLQVLVFNNIQFSGYVNPYVYVMFILLLPFDMPAWLLLFVSFLLGMIMDFFSGTPGMHASASVLAGFVRPAVLGFISGREGYESNNKPAMATYGFRWFLFYATVIVFIHHFALFYLEVFRFNDFSRTFFRVILSSFFSIIFILLLEFYRGGKIAK